MSADPRFDRLIETRFPGARLLAASLLAGGVSATTSLLEVELADGGRRRVVVREHGPRHCGHDFDTEHRLLRSLQALGVKAPPPLGAGAGWDGGGPYVLLAFVPGSTEIAAEEARSRIELMAGELVTIHHTPTAALPALPLRTEPLPELLDYLPTGAAWAPIRAGFRGFQHAPFGGSPVLLHGDFWPGNVVWRDGRVAAVLDWEDAAVGDPLSDVACGCLELSYLFGAEGARWFRDAYAAVEAVDPVRFALWQAYVAAAAQSNMAAWALPPDREAMMRRTALASLREAARVLGLPGSSPPPES